MAFCNKCGAPLEEGAKFCNVCGTPTGEQPAKAAQPAAQPAAAAAPAAPKKNFITDTPDHTSAFTDEERAKGKALSILSYLWFLVLIPAFAGRDSRYVRFHVKQGLVLSMATSAYLYVQNILLDIFQALLWNFIVLKIIYVFIAVCLWFVFTVFIALMVLGIIYAAKGKAKELPIVGLCFPRKKAETEEEAK